MSQTLMDLSIEEVMNTPLSLRDCMSKIRAECATNDLAQIDSKDILTTTFKV